MIATMKSSAIPSTSSREMLLRAAQTGDEVALERLLILLGPLVEACARGMLGNRPEADDVYQNVFLKFWHRLQCFHPDRPLEAWLRKVTMHECLDVLRRNGRRQRDVEMEPDRLPDQTGMNERESDRWCWIQGQLMRLPPRERAAIVLVYQQGLSTREAAHALGCRKATIRSLCYKARNKLRSWREASEEGIET